MVLDTSLLNTQHYKVRIKGKVEQRPPLHLGVVTSEKGAFWSPSTKVANFTYFYLTYRLGGDKRIHTFPQVISPKVNIIARLEFELACSNLAVQPLHHGESPF